MQPTAPTTASDRPLFVTAALLGALAVAFGAFGAHGVEGAMAEAVDGAKRLEWWRTAAHYHLIHSLLALGFALLATTPERARAARVGVALVVAGVVFFCGSLYAMTLSNIRMLGAITPIGGLAFIAAWLWLIRVARR